MTGYNVTSFETASADRISAYPEIDIREAEAE
jgi:hypothetical protein